MNGDTFDLGLLDGFGNFVGDEIAGFDNRLLGLRIGDFLGSDTSDETSGKNAGANIVSVLQALILTTVKGADDDVMRDVNQAAGKITSVGGTKSSISQTLAVSTDSSHVLEDG